MFKIGSVAFPVAEKFAILDNAIRPPKPVHVENAAQVVARYLDAAHLHTPMPRELAAIETLLQFAMTKRDA